MINTPNNIHEAPITPLISSLDLVIKSIGHNTKGVQIHIEANTSHLRKKMVGKPDILIQISGRSF